MDGVATKRDPGLPVEGNADLRADLPRPPASLGEALAVFECSPFVKKTFGTDIAAHYAAHARAEWKAYLSAVTDWEIIRAFEAV
jgi:glutamine synthetase